MGNILKTFSMFALALLVFAGVSDAATTGKVQGTVRDAQSGEALPGANVVIDGTQRGAVTDANGFFVILLVEPGAYSMTGSMVGYDAQRQTAIRVQSDLTTTVDFQIREKTLELGEITVIAERPPVEPDKTTSKYIMSAEDLESVPIVRDMGEFIELQAGVSIDAEGDEIMIRGGDRQDVAYVVDGVRITTTDHRGSRTGIGRSLNKSAVQELQVITGGYNAEYGNAQGGVVSMVTRDGGSSYNGMVDYQFTPAGQKHWGANVYDSPMHRGNNNWDDPDWVSQQVEIPADLDGDGANDVIQAHKRLDYTGKMGHRVDANLAGPLSRDITFFASTIWQKTPSAMLDANLTTPPNTRNTGKLTFAASPNLKLRVGGIYNRRQNTFTGPDEGGRLNLRDNGRNIFLHIVNPTGNYRDTDGLFYGTVTHSLSPKTFYEVNLSYSTTTRDTLGLHAHPSIGNPNLTSSSVRDGSGHFTIYREVTNWSLFGYKRMGFKADLSSQVNKQNFVKAGIEVIRYNNWYQSRWSNGPTNRYVRWFSKSFEESAFWPNQENVGLNPIDFGVYVQDKIEFEGMIVNAGIRGEVFFQNTMMKDVDGWFGSKAPWNGMTRSRWVPEVKGKAIKAFQPRIGVSHPITEKSLLRFFYGRFVQRPQFHEMFENEYSSNEAVDNDLNGNGVIDPAEQYNEYNDTGRHGTRFLPPEETTSFEVGLDWNFVGDYVLGLTTYYKASGNETRSASQQWYDPESPQYVATVRAYAPGNWRDVRGFEINLRKKFSNMFSFNVGYNLQWADSGRNSAHRRDVWPDSLFVANGYYMLRWTSDNSGAEMPVPLSEEDRIRLGERADNHLQSRHRNVVEFTGTGSAWSWIPWYSHYANQGARYVAGQAPTNLGEYDDADREYWENAARHINDLAGYQMVSGEGTLMVAHNQESGERAPLTADRRSFGSISFLFATPSNYGPFGGKAVGNLRANLVYRLYTGSRFTYSTGGIQGFRYGPIHTRADFNAEKVFGNTSGVNITLAVEVYNLFNQKDTRSTNINNESTLPIDFNSDRYQQYGILGLEPTNPDIAALNLANPETSDITNYWDSPREMNFSLRIKW